MPEELLTVMLSTYNHKDSFRAAIDSVLAQKTNFDFKIWILDDASNDGTTDIVLEYADKYPSRIIPIVNKINTKGAVLKEYIKKVTSKYYTFLETDDYWCDENKLQLQIDILENNPDCSMCAHNTLRKYIDFNKSEPYLKVKEGKYSLPEKRLTHGYIEPHTSSRIYRTACIDFNEVQDSDIIAYDVSTVFYFLTKGKMYYIDKIMSVYNYTGCGVFSSSSSYQNRYRAANGIYRLNKQLGFEYNYLLARFFATRLNLNFILSNGLKKCKNLVILDNMYQRILADFKNKYFADVDKKPVFSCKIPIGCKKRLCFELFREKDLC